MSSRFACIWICLCVAMMGSVSSISHSSLEDYSDSFESHADRGSMVVTFDDSIHSDAVNAMDFDSEGNLIVGGSGCARDSSQLTVPYSCTMAFEGGNVSTDDFIPSFVSIIDSDGSKRSTYLFSSGFGDRVDAVLSLSNGDILVAEVSAGSRLRPMPLRTGGGRYVTNGPKPRHRRLCIQDDWTRTSSLVNGPMVRG